MKRPLLAFALGLAGLWQLPAHALTDNKDFVVGISLTPGCALGTPTGITFAYTGGQTSASTGTGGAFTLLCTTNLGYSFSLDANNGGAGGNSSTYTDSTTQLNYTLTAPAAGSATGSLQNLSLTATMAANQAGTCGATPSSGTACNNTSAAANTKTRTLTVTY